MPAYDSPYGTPRDLDTSLESSINKRDAMESGVMSTLKEGGATLDYV